MRQTLTDDSWGLHKIMNCAFLLTKQESEINALMILVDTRYLVYNLFVLRIIAPVFGIID